MYMYIDDVILDWILQDPYLGICTYTIVNEYIEYTHVHVL